MQVDAKANSPPPARFVVNNNYLIVVAHRPLVVRQPGHGPRGALGRAARPAEVPVALDHDVGRALAPEDLPAAGVRRRGAAAAEIRLLPAHPLPLVHYVIGALQEVGDLRGQTGRGRLGLEVRGRRGEGLPDLLLVDAQDEVEAGVEDDGRLLLARQLLEAAVVAGPGGRLLGEDTPGRGRAQAAQAGRQLMPRGGVGGAGAGGRGRPREDQAGRCRVGPDHGDLGERPGLEVVADGRQRGPPRDERGGRVDVVMVVVQVEGRGRGARHGLAVGRRGQRHLGQESSSLLGRAGLIITWLLGGFGRHYIIKTARRFYMARCSMTAASVYFRFYNLHCWFVAIHCP